MSSEGSGFYNPCDGIDCLVALLNAVTLSIGSVLILVLGKFYLKASA